MNNNNKFVNKTGYNQNKNEAHKQGQNKQASQTNVTSQKESHKNAEPKAKQTESARDNYRSESNRK